MCPGYLVSNWMLGLEPDQVYGRSVSSLSNRLILVVYPYVFHVHVTG